MIPLSNLVPGVRATGDNLVFEVQSRSRPRIWHRVDFAAISGFGQCSCERSSLGLARAVRNAKELTPAMECNHLTRARRFLAMMVAQRIIQSRSGQANPVMTRREWSTPPW